MLMAQVQGLLSQLFSTKLGVFGAGFHHCKTLQTKSPWFICSHMQPASLQPTRLPSSPSPLLRLPVLSKKKPKGGPTWLLEDGEVGFPTGKLHVGELHDAVVHWVGTEDSIGVICFWNQIQES